MFSIEWLWLISAPMMFGDDGKKDQETHRNYYDFGWNNPNVGSVRAAHSDKGTLLGCLAREVLKIVHKLRYFKNAGEPRKSSSFPAASPLESARGL